MTPIRFAVALSAALLALPSVAASHDPLAAPPAGASCLGGLSAGYCALATAAASVSCSMTATDYTCSVSASWGQAGSTSGPLGGQVSGPAWLDVNVCDASGCGGGVTSVGGSCSWALGGHGCSTSGSSGPTLVGTHDGCIEVAVSVQVHAHVQAAGVPLTLVQDQAFAAAVFANC